MILTRSQNNDSTNIIIIGPNYHRIIHRNNPIGDNMVEIYRSKMQPGELISYDYTMRMYNGET